MAKRRITILVENTAGGRNLLAEHGLSLWIEIGPKKILFDTGQGNVLKRNARVLGVQLERTDAVVLSHGHYDHTGGLLDALRSAGRATVYAHPEAFAPKYARNPDGAASYIGMPFVNRQAVLKQANLVRVEGPTEIGEGLYLSGPVPRATDFEDTGGPFFKDRGCNEPDDLADDQAAFMETAIGTIIILGCAHAGVINTLRYIQTLTDNRPIHTVIGGMHLLNASPGRMENTVAELRRLSVQRLLPCHCTGSAAMARLRNEFPGGCGTCQVGAVVEIEG